MPALLGCIADDFTGATDLAGTLVRAGMRTVQMIDVPEADTVPADADAIVIALKSRTVPAADAVAQSLASLKWLQVAGCRQFVFKICSTFDSTDEGNIGPVAEALLAALDTDFAMVCPAFPRNARRVYKGYLFVGDVLLSESGMEQHPLTPMTDPNLVRVLDRQTRGAVGLLPYDTIQNGTAAVTAACERLHTEGVSLAIADTLAEGDFEVLAAAVAEHVLVVGASGIGTGLAGNFRRRGLLGHEAVASQLAVPAGRAAVLAGSCSQATREQVARAVAHYPAIELDPLQLAKGEDAVADVLIQAREYLETGPVLIYSSSEPEALQAVQNTLGAARAATVVEAAMASLARGLVAAGVTRLVVAGGETSGAVVKALDIRGLRIGTEIDPGVPWTLSLGEPAMGLVLKSGNFGSRDFFLKALATDGLMSRSTRMCESDLTNSK